MDQLDLLTLREAAEQLGVPEPTLRAWIRKGRIRAIKSGRAWRIPAAAVAAHLTQATNRHRA